ncbi:MAG TPA: hypothetical protein VFV05_03265 [Methylomirabilota bacterium]|nr:hypothetical protein [Methylomirabilota bacterium]
MDGIHRRLIALVFAASCAGAPATAQTLVATPAPPGVATELSQALERARGRFEARDLSGVLASVSEQYRSGGMTKAAVHEQLLAMFTLYQELRARVTVDRVELVNGGTRVYTSGEVTGRLPLVGWVVVLTWQGEPEVVRREAAGWRLFGFQD